MNKMAISGLAKRVHFNNCALQEQVAFLHSSAWNCLSLYPLYPCFFVLQIVFEAVRGNGYRGDIAVDDISFINTPCTGNLTL